MNFIECFWVALKLGLTSFGGPVAHLGYFREEYVIKRKWIDEERFAELIAICQFLPGPASSQLGAAVGYERAGWLGGFFAWLGFTLPSALLMTALAVGLASVEGLVGNGWVHGLKVAAVAVVAVAILGMKRKLCPTWPKKGVAVAALLVLMVVEQAWMQPLVILGGGVVGAIWFSKYAKKSERLENARKPYLAIGALLVMVMVLVLLPYFVGDSEGGKAFAGIVRSGALVFGGGHVVLPLLEAEMVSTGYMARDTFLAGYGAAQAVPGPMFSLGAYLGGILSLGGNPWLGGVLGTVAIFGPGLILLSAGLPLWNRIKHIPRAQGAVVGANAVVVGLLGAALVHMIMGGVLQGWIDYLLAAVYFVVIGTRKLPVWLVILIAAVLGGIIWG